MIAIEQQLDIPKPHFDYFVACNSIGYKSFYLLKDKILKVFGHENDYDIQHLKKKCYSCNGTGFYHQNIRCYKCNNGVYEEYDVILQRYILNNSCFHIPLGRLEGNRLKIWDGYYNNDEWGYPEISKWRYELFHGIIKNSINGLIKHDPPKKLNPQFGYWFTLRQANIQQPNNNMAKYHRQKRIPNQELPMANIRPRPNGISQIL